MTTSGKIKNHVTTTIASSVGGLAGVGAVTSLALLVIRKIGRFFSAITR